jgi:transposase-like protein
MVSFKGAHFAKDVILTCVRWYVAYPIPQAYRQYATFYTDQYVVYAGVILRSSTERSASWP